MCDSWNDVVQDCRVITETVSIALWRGKCNIRSQNIDINLSAHLPKNPKPFVSKLASKFPDSLCLKLLPRQDVQPAYYNCLPPTEFHIDLLFFSDGSDEKVLDALLNDAVCGDLALEAKVGSTKLLMFTSLQLPEKLHRLDGKFYLWGQFVLPTDVFAPKSDNDAHIGKNEPKKHMVSSNNDAHIEKSEPRKHRVSSDNDAHIEKNEPKKHRIFSNSVDQWRFAGKANAMNISEKQSLCKLTREHSNHTEIDETTNRLSSNSDSQRSFQENGGPINISDERNLFETRGRKLDDAWEHAKQLDESRQKIECKFCGYISTFGGISRLKVHLAGGSLRSHLPGCKKVSPEVKHALAIWYCGWLKDRKAIRLKRNLRVTRTARDETGGRKLDAAWEHAKPLDESRQKIECKHCGFVSMHGGISRLKVHLVGGNLRSLIPGCKRVPQEVKHALTIWYREWVKDKKAIRLKKKPGDRRKTDPAWEHFRVLESTGKTQTIECLFCGKNYRNPGITRMKQHLAGKSGNISKCPKVPDHIHSAMVAALKEIDSQKAKLKEKSQFMEIDNEEKEEEQNFHVQSEN